MGTVRSFRFGIGDIARFLGKSPVTLRSWEAKGLYDFPRNASGDRSMTLDQLDDFVAWAMQTSKITINRCAVITCAINSLRDVENHE